MTHCLFVAVVFSVFAVPFVVLRIDDVVVKSVFVDMVLLFDEMIVVVAANILVVGVVLVVFLVFLVGLVGPKEEPFVVLTFVVLLISVVVDTFVVAPDNVVFALLNVSFVCVDSLVLGIRVVLEFSLVVFTDDDEFILDVVMVVDKLS